MGAPPKSNEILQKAYASLSQRYRQNDPLVPKAITSCHEAEAYAHARSPATQAVLSFLSSWVQDISPRITSILDVGAGTGAAPTVWKTLLGHATWHLVEPNAPMRQYLEKRISCLFPKGHPFRLYKALHEAEAGDLVLASYVCNEVPQDHLLSFIEMLWAKTRQRMILTLPGTPRDYDLLMKIRDHLLHLGAHLRAPCPQSGPCPLLQGDWCHFSLRIHRSQHHQTLKKATKGFEDEKFCYLVVDREPYDTSPSWDRVIKKPRHRSGHILLDLCTPAGRLEKIIVSRKNTLYAQAKDLQWGDSVETKLFSDKDSSGDT